MRLASSGALVPVRGFSRVPWKAPAPSTAAAWRSHDGLLAVSSHELAQLPGSGDPPLVGPSWLVSVSRSVGGLEARCRVTDDDVARVVECFAMPAFDEDNHHPGLARHLWCPVDAAYQQACECKLTERTIVDGDYAWTTDTDGPCRGCEYRELSGLPCPLHPA